MKLLFVLCLLCILEISYSKAGRGGGSRSGGGGSRPSPSGGGSRPSPSGGGSKPSPPSGGGNRPSGSGGNIPSGGPKPSTGTGTGTGGHGGLGGTGGGPKPPPSGPVINKPSGGPNTGIGPSSGIPSHPDNSGGLRPPPFNPSWPGPHPSSGGSSWPHGGYSVQQVPTSAGRPQTVVWAPSRNGFSKPGSSSSSLLQKTGIFFAGAFVGNRLSHVANRGSYSWYNSRYHRNYYYGRRYYTYNQVPKQTGSTSSQVNNMVNTSSMICSFDISNDDSMFDLTYDDGSRVSEILYECNVNSEWCCDDFDCCSTESLGLNNSTDLIMMPSAISNFTDIYNSTTNSTLTQALHFLYNLSSFVHG